MVKQLSVAQYAHKMKLHRSTIYKMIEGKSLPEGVTARVIATRIVIEVDTDLWKKK